MGIPPPTKSSERGKLRLYLARASEVGLRQAASWWPDFRLSLPLGLAARVRENTRDDDAMNLSERRPGNEIDLPRAKSSSAFAATFAALTAFGSIAPVV